MSSLGSEKSQIFKGYPTSSAPRSERLWRSASRNPVPPRPKLVPLR